MNDERKMDVIDAESLMAMPLKQTTFFVEGLIPQGLTVLAGASKAGKSWMVLWMALKIARGEELWGLKTKKSDVLYLSLEDTRARLQRRLYELTESSPLELRLATYAPRIGAGLEDEMSCYLDMYPGTKLIIIDTLQKIRDARSSLGVGMYAADYDDIGALKKFADEKGIGIIVVHHLRKMKDGSDPFNEITGSTGIMGAADSTLLLRGERGETSAKLVATGRDIEYQELLLQREQEKYIWHLKERKGALKLKREKVHPFVHRVADFAKRSLFWSGSASELLTALGETHINNYQVTRLLARFSEEALSPQGITYESLRNHKGRYINLIYKDPEKYDELGNIRESYLAKNMTV